MQLHIIFIFRPRIRLKNPRVFKKLDFFALIGERKLFSRITNRPPQKRGIFRGGPVRLVWTGGDTHNTAGSLFEKRESGQTGKGGISCLHD